MILTILASEKMKNNFLKNSPGFTKWPQDAQNVPEMRKSGDPRTTPGEKICYFLSKFWICGMIYGGSAALTGQLFDGVLSFWI